MQNPQQGREVTVLSRTRRCTVSLGYSKHRLGPRNTLPRSGEVRLEVIFGANPRARSFLEHNC